MVLASVLFLENEAGMQDTSIFLGPARDTLHVCKGDRNKIWRRTGQELRTARVCFWARVGKSWHPPRGAALAKKQWEENTLEAQRGKCWVCVALGF